MAFLGDVLNLFSPFSVTQFEASDERRCLPCWDEPALKVTFTITLLLFYDYLSQILYCRTDGSDGWCAVTQFEASDARRCFPCWDEPALKATFTITLNVPADRVALSNMVSADVKRLCGLNLIKLLATV